MTKRKAMADLRGMKPTEFLRHVQDLKSEVKKYYHFDSRLWKAIVKEISEPDSVLGPRRPEWELVWHRGTGPAVSFIRVTLYTDFDNSQSKPAETFSLTLSATYYDREEEVERVVQRCIEVPVDLEDNFVQANFDQWIESLRLERDNGRTQKELEKLQQLIAEHPEDAKRMIQCLNQNRPS